MTRRRLRTRPYSYGDFEERVEAAVAFGVRRAMKHRTETLPEDAVEAIVEQVTREVTSAACDMVAFPRGTT